MDNAFDVTVTRSVADASDTLVLADGNLSVVTEENIYELQDNSLIASSSLLNGTLTATSWVYNSEPEKIVEFKYNAAGLRVQKDVTTNGVTETTKYILRGKQIAEMVCGEDRLHFFYDAQNRPTKVNFNGELYTYVHSLQGDIVGIVDDTGELVVEYKYDAWGKSLTIEGTLQAVLEQKNPFRYRSYVYDFETTLFYICSRYYNHDWRRFINSDTLLGTDDLISHNLFAYCANNPITYYDPTGKVLALPLFLVGAAAIFGFTTLAASRYILTDKANKESFNSRTSKFGSPSQPTIRDIFLLTVVILYSKKTIKPKTPDVTYPGDDPAIAPEGYEWRGSDEQGGEKGGYANPNGKDSWHPDLNHPNGVDPHWDYNDGFGNKWRVFPDRIELTK